MNKQDSCEECRSLIRCQYCPTAVFAEMKRLDKDSKGGILIITKWQVLGWGLSPLEACWEAHLEDSPGTYSHTVQIVRWEVFGFATRISLESNMTLS